MATAWIEQVTGSARAKEEVPTVQGPRETASGELSHRDRSAGPVLDVLRVDHERGHPGVDAGGSRRSLRAERSGRDGPSGRRRGGPRTTIVKILSTLLRPDAGTATVNGFDVTTNPLQVRESISLTGQFAAVDESLSGRENLVLVAKLRHLNDPGQVADDLLARFNLVDAASRKVSTYSGGMRRRLDIAMSLIGQPTVIFLDEPTTGLDPEGHRGVADRSGARRAGDDCSAHHAISRRGGATRRSDRHSSSGAHSSRTALSPS